MGCTATICYVQCQEHLTAIYYIFQPSKDYLLMCFVKCQIFRFFTFLFQVVPIRKLSSRLQFPYWASATVSNAILTSSQVACCAPAPPMTTIVWTVAVEIAAVHWCVKGQAEVGLYMGSRRGVTLVDCKMHLVSTQKSPPLWLGLGRSLASRTFFYNLIEPITNILTMDRETKHILE